MATLLEPVMAPLYALNTRAVFSRHWTIHDRLKIMLSVILSMHSNNNLDYFGLYYLQFQEEILFVICF
jgi:hypothetical protein